MQHGVSDQMRRDTKDTPRKDWWETDQFTRDAWLLDRCHVHNHIARVTRGEINTTYAIERAFARALNTRSGDFYDLNSLYEWHKKYTAGHEVKARRAAVAHSTSSGCSSKASPAFGCRWTREGPSAKTGPRLQATSIAISAISSARRTRSRELRKRARESAHGSIRC